MVSLTNTALLRGLAALSTARARLREELGQDLLEYALLGGLIAAALTAVGVFAAMTGALNGMAAGIGECINFNDLNAPC